MRLSTIEGKVRKENEINKNKTFTVSINKSISRCGLLFFCTKKSIHNWLLCYNRSWGGSLWGSLLICVLDAHFCQSLRHEILQPGWQKDSCNSVESKIALKNDWTEIDNLKSIFSSILQLYVREWHSNIQMNNKMS